MDHLTEAAQWIAYAFGRCGQDVGRADARFRRNACCNAIVIRARCASRVDKRGGCGGLRCAAACCVGFGGRTIPRPDASTQVRARCARSCPHRLENGHCTATHGPGACRTCP